MGIVSVIAVASAACGILDSGPPGEPPPAEPEVRVVAAMPVDIAGWDPHSHRCHATDSVLANVFDPLIWRSADHELEPALATAWWQESEHTWRLELREGVLWHDGEMFGPDDVIYSLQRLAGIGEYEMTARYPHFRGVAEVTQTDAMEIEIRTHVPDPLLPQRLSQPGAAILPAHRLARAEDLEEAERTFAADPVGTGPYRVLAWHPDERIRLGFFSDHWRGAAAITDLTFMVIPEVQGRIDTLLQREADLALYLRFADWTRIGESPGHRVVRQIGPQVVALHLSTRSRTETADVRVREAIELAIDEQYLIDEILLGTGTPTRTTITPPTPGSPPELYNTHVYHPERARAILESIPLDEPRLTLLVPQERYPAIDALADAIVEMLASVGLSVYQDVKPMPEYREIITDDNGPEMYLSLEAGCSVNALTSFELWAADERYQPSSQIVDETFTRVLRRATSEQSSEIRARDIRALAELTARFRPVIPLAHLLVSYGIDTELEWTPRPDGLLWMWPAVRAPN